MREYHSLTRHLFLYILVFPFCFVRGQNRKIDSLRTVIKANTKQDTNKVNELNQLAFELYPFNLQSFKANSENALSLSKKLNYKKGKGMASVNLALSLMLTLGNVNALNYLDTALNIFRNLKDKENTAITLNRIGCYYATIKDYQEAFPYFKAALNELGGSGKPGELAILNNIGNYFEDIGQLKKAKEYYDKLLNKALKINNDEYSSIGYYDIASLYFKEKNNDLAVFYCDKSLAFVKTISFRSQQEIYILLGDINLNLKNYKKALDFYEKSAGIAKDMKSPENMEKIYHSLYLIDSAKGNYISALKNHYQYSKLKDSLINADKNNLIALYQVKFGVEKRSEENKHLKIIADRNLELIKRQRITQIITFTSLIIICIGAIYLKRVNNIINKKNKVIEDQNKLLENNDKVKNTIFSVISHDLRNPLAQVLGLLNLWSDGDLSNQEITLLIPKVRDASLNTLDLLDNLLIWSKSQLQGFDFKPSSFNMIQLVTDVLKKLEYVISQKSIIIKNETAPLITAFADREMITIILRNLISNAVKFTPKNGTVEIATSKKTGFVLVCITDTGVGIKEKYKDKVFTATGHSTPGTANEKGTGLGLKICKEFIELNKGRIWMESKENIGSKFYISIPLGEGVEQTPGTQEAFAEDDHQIKLPF